MAVLLNLADRSQARGNWRDGYPIKTLAKAKKRSCTAGITCQGLILFGRRGWRWSNSHSGSSRTPWRWGTRWAKRPARAAPWTRLRGPTGGSARTCGTVRHRWHPQCVISVANAARSLPARRRFTVQRCRPERAKRRSMPFDSRTKNPRPSRSIWRMRCVLIRCVSRCLCAFNVSFSVSARKVKTTVVRSRLLKKKKL